MTWLAALMMMAPFAPATPADCAGRHDVALRAADVAMTCKYEVTGCRGDADIVIENCSGAPVELRGVVFRLKTRAAASWELEPGAFVVPSGQQRVFRGWVYNPGPLEVDALLVGRARPLRARARVTNPAVDAAVAACRACRGVWGVDGVIPTLGCDCRAADAGRRCRFDSDCDRRCVRGRCTAHGSKGCVYTRERGGSQGLPSPQPSPASGRGGRI